MSSLVSIPDAAGLKPDILDIQKTPDGFKLRYAVFKSIVKPNKGTILLLQGRNEAIEKYIETIEHFFNCGFDVVTFDWRGQGRSSRFFSDHRRGHIDSFEQYKTDLDTVFSKVALPECRSPFFIIAHSTGALIALYSAPFMANRITRMMLSSPFLGIGNQTLSESQIIFLSSMFNFVGLGTMHMGGSRNGIADIPFENNLVTTDKKRYERNKKLMDPANGLGLGSATAGWLYASMKALEVIRRSDHMAQIHIPTLLVNAGADTIVSMPAVEDYAQRIRSGALITIDGARHELMQETDKYRNQFLSAFDAFIPGTSN